MVTAFDADELYASPPPWDLGRPQPAFLELADRGSISGRVLDVGCGTGEHVLMCAERGSDATGIDLSGRAVEKAREKARERGLSASFRELDVLRVGELGGPFDTVLDCGLFHMPHFTSADRAAYVAGVGSVLAVGGRFHLLCFSDHVPADYGGPHRFTREELVGWFTDGWRAESVERTTIEITIDPAGRAAWLVTVRRT